MYLDPKYDTLLKMSKLSIERLPKVGFTGPSGAGKTTQTEYFGRNTGFTAFQGDEILFEGFSAYPKLAEKIFGRAPEAGEDGRAFAYSNYLPLTSEKERAIFELMRDYVEEQLVWAFHNPTTDFGSHDKLHNAVLFQPKDENGIIRIPKGIAVEMCGFHRAKHLARRTDFTVLVDSNPEQRKKMLSQRPNMQDFIKQGKFDEIVAIREAVQGELLKGVKPDVSLMNKYDDTSLERGQRQIVTTMKERGIEL